MGLLRDCTTGCGTDGSICGTQLHCIALGHSLAAFMQSLTICLQNPFYQSYCIYNNTTITTLCKNSFGCTTTRSQSSAVKAAEFECRLVETKHKYYCELWMEKENAININSFLGDQNVSTCTSINQFSDEPVRKWFKIFKFTIYLVVNYIRLEFVKYREFYPLCFNEMIIIQCNIYIILCNQ